MKTHSFGVLVWVFSSFSILPSSFASAETVLNYYFELLKDLPRNEINEKGKVCEKIAAIEIGNELHSIFPSKNFEIVHNVVYRDKSERILGELDLIVLDKQTDKVILVVEVKCRSDLKKAFKKAKQQLERFRFKLEEILERHLVEEEVALVSYVLSRKLRKDLFGIFLEENDDILITADNGARTFNYEQFAKGTKYRIVSQKEDGARRDDVKQLKLNLQELEKLTNMLITYHELMELSHKQINQEEPAA